MNSLKDKESCFRERPEDEGRQRQAVTAARPGSDPAGLAQFPRAAYFERPRLTGERPAGRVPWLALGGLIAIMMAGGAAVSTVSDRPAAGVSRLAEAQAVRAPLELVLPLAALDTEATRQARRELRDGHIPAFLAKADRRILQGVLAGERRIFRVKLVDSDIEDNDIVKVSVDGLELGIVSLRTLGSQLLLPAREGPTELRIEALQDGGGGGVTFGMVTQDGRSFARVMQVGEIQTWRIQTTTGEVR